MLLKLLKLVVYQICDKFIMSFNRAGPDSDVVLIVRLDAIGDFVMWLDAGVVLSMFYKEQGKTIILLGNSAWSEWARDLGYFDSVVDIEPYKFEHNLFYRWSWLRKLSAIRCGIVIQPTFSRMYYQGDSAVRAVTASERIGSIGDTSNMHPALKRISDKWYSRLIPASPAALMELERNAEFLCNLGIESCRPGIACIPARATENEITIRRPYVILFPGANWPGRRWPADRFGEVGRLVYKMGYEIVLLGGTSDKELALKIKTQLSGAAIDMTGRTTLQEMADTIRYSSLVVTNDTSAAHIAAAVRTPVITILGGGHYGRFLPYKVEGPDVSIAPHVVCKNMNCFGCNWKCKYPHKPNEPVKCIADITVADVMGYVSLVLNNQNQSGGVQLHE